MTEGKAPEWAKTPLVPAMITRLFCPTLGLF
jgi:hypothetical protein